MLFKMEEDRVSQRGIDLCALALAFTVVLVLSGCASSPIDLSKTKSFPQNDGVVFGRVRIISDGETEKLTTIFGESRFGVLLLPDQSSKAMYVPLKDDGSFFWHLPPGGYTIAGFEYQKSTTGRIFAHFDVIKDKVTYVGTLTIMFRGSRYAISVEDEYDSAIKEFRKRFSEIKGEARKSLLEMEKRR